MSTPPEIKEYDARIEEVRKEKEAAIDGQDFEGAASLRDKEQTLQDERNQKEQEWRDEADHGIDEVDEDLIAEVLSRSTVIPLFRLAETEAERLRNMEDELHRRVIGQDEAVNSLSRAIRRTRAGLKDPHRPTGSFIFAGPTGVGKTELAKTLSEFLFGDE